MDHIYCYIMKGYILQCSTDEGLEVWIVTPLVPHVCSQYVSYHTKQILEDKLHSLYTKTA